MKKYNIVRITSKTENSSFLRLKQITATVYWIRKIKAVEVASMILSINQSGQNLTP